MSAKYEEWYQKNQNWWEKFWPRIADYKYSLIKEERRKQYDPSRLRSYPTSPPTASKIFTKEHSLALYPSFFWLRACPDIRALLMPFTADRFMFSTRQMLLPHGVDWHIKDIEIGFGHTFGSESAPLTFFFKRPVQPYISDERQRFRPSIVGEIKQFLNTHKEGAFVVFELIYKAYSFVGGPYSSFPSIENRDPVEVCLLARRINNLMRRYAKNTEAYVDYFSYEASWSFEKWSTRRNGKLEFSLDVGQFSFYFSWSREAKTFLDLFLTKAPVAQREWWRVADEDARNYVFTRALSRISQFRTDAYPRQRALRHRKWFGRSSGCRTNMIGSKPGDGHRIKSTACEKTTTGI